MASRDTMIHRQAEGYRWEGVQELPYKEDDRALFKSVTRQVLFADPELYGELRYFEVAPGGYSTLERHQHMHAVMILRGRGHCLVGEEVRPVETRDLVTVPAMTAVTLGGGSRQPRARCEDRRLPAQRADLERIDANSGLSAHA